MLTNNFHVLILTDARVIHKDEVVIDWASLSLSHTCQVGLTVPIFVNGHY